MVTQHHSHKVMIMVLHHLNLVHVHHLVDNIQKKYYLVKKLYKKLSLIFHPDKGGDNNIFIIIKRYYDYNLLIGLLSICYNNNIKIPKLSDEDERQILNEFIFLFKKL